jgi:sugar phosphate permease
MFGFLETGRGLIDTIVNFAALGIFALLGSNLAGFSSGLVFFSVLTIAIGVASFFLLEDDAIAKAGSASNKNKEAFQGMLSVFKNPAIWIVALNVFSVYAVYTGIRYFSPFLRDVYGMPVVLVSTYAIINSYVLKMVGGPIGGLISDKVTHSAAKFIRIMFVLVMSSLILFIALSYRTVNVYTVMAIALLTSSFIFCQRAVFFAPMDEIRVPRSNTGAAMALGSFIGYLPGAFMGIIYGTQLDAHPGVEGSRIVFTIMVSLAVSGFVISSILVRAINNKRNSMLKSAQELETVQG